MTHRTEVRFNFSSQQAMTVRC